MKKLYALLFLFTAWNAFAQSVVISTVVDGTLGANGCTGTNGSSSPKITELYVSGTVDFTNYRFQTESNGAADASLISWNSGLDLTPLGSITDAFVYLVVSSGDDGTQTFNEMYPAITLPTGLAVGSIPNGNGNDSYRIAIYDAATGGNLLSVIDQFGNPLDIPAGSGDYSAVWAYQDSYAKRNNGVGPNGGDFQSSAFIYGGNGLFADPNNDCAFISNAIGLGSYQLANKPFAVEAFKVYPNPVSNGLLYINSGNNNVKQVAVFDLLGKPLLKTTVTDQPLDVTKLNSGMYLLQVTENGRTATKKIVVR